MRKLIKLVVVVAVLAVLAMVGLVAWLSLAFPKVAPAPTLEVARTPERLQRGRYLFDHVAACVSCHSKADVAAYASPPVPGSDGCGGQAFGAGYGVPGTVYASNITPAGIAAYSDGELLRALTCGVTRDGRALFPTMPYTHYRDAARDDLEAVIAYVRTLPAITNAVPEGRLLFPMNIIVKTIPRDAQPPAHAPDSSDEIAYGRYLVDVAACMQCHSPSEHGTPIAGCEFSGGVAFTTADGATVRSANITPDDATGIGRWPREQFVQRFRMWAGRRVALTPGQLNTPMPWTQYGGMTEADLGAIYAWLRTVKPVANHVGVAGAD